MNANMGSLDRIIRLVLVVAAVGLYLMNMISGTVAIVLGVLAAIFLLTSIIGFCPLYKIVGLSTRSTANS